MDKGMTYDDFLRSLSIKDILVDAGYTLNKRDGLRYPSYVRYGSDGTRIRGDKFIVTQNGNCCFRPPEQKLYNVISFIKAFPEKFTEFRGGMSSDHLVNLVCNRLMNNPIVDNFTHHRNQIAEVKPFSLDDYTLHLFNPQDRETQKKFYPYFKHRGIDLYTQYAFHKHITLATKERPDGKSYTNLSFPLTLPSDKEHKIVGFEERGKPQNDGTSYKGKAEGSNSSNGLWIANLSGKSLEDADKVLWFESAYDAMAYYQLHRQSGADTKAVYVSTGGNPTENQFRGLVGVTPQAKHHLCFDNDNAGRIFALNFIYQPSMAWRDYVYSINNSLDVKSGDFSLLPKETRDLYAKAESLEIEYYSSKSSGLVCKEDLENIKAEAILAIKEFNDAISEALPFRCSVAIEQTPSGYKDWNDALFQGNTKEMESEETIERTGGMKR